MSRGFHLLPMVEQYCSAIEVTGRHRPNHLQFCSTVCLALGASMSNPPSETSDCWPSDPNWLDGAMEMDLSRQYKPGAKCFFVTDLLNQSGQPLDTVINVDRPFKARFRIEIRPPREWEEVSGTWSFDLAFAAIGEGDAFALSHLLGKSGLRHAGWSGKTTSCIEVITDVPPGALPEPSEPILYQVSATVMLQPTSGLPELVAGHDALGEYLLIPSKTAEANVASEPEVLPDTVIGTDEFPPEESDEREPPKSQEREPVIYTPAATAALPVYDADAVAQRDLIGVEKFVNAFSYLIAARTMQPPLAVGLFGHWGSGKTFLMRSIQRRVDQITRGARESERAQAEIGVYKRVVQIEFNAWHYVEGNLWASLVDHIFANLRTSVEERGSELDRRRKAITRQLVSTRQEQRVLAQRIKRLGALRKEKQSTVNSLESEQRRRLQEAEKLRMQDVAAVVTLDTQDIQAVDAALSKVGIEFGQQSAADAAHSLEDARTIVVDGNTILAPMRQYGWRWAALLAVIVLVAPVISGLMDVFKLSVPTQILSSIAALLSSTAFVANKGARWTGQALKEIETAHTRVRKRVEQASADQARRIATLKQEIDVLDRKLADALRDRDKADSEIGDLQEKFNNLTPGKLLAEFLEQRSTSGDYRKYLGLTALIRRDFEELSRLVALNNAALLSPAPSPEGGAADFNRVVLYVDDLDRCKSSQIL